MESPRSHGHGDGEEKSSCESGWTMYIEDTFHGNHPSNVVYDDYNDDDDDDDGRVKAVNDDSDDDDDDESSDDESNDSMTSDASSGPSTQLSKNTKKHAAPKNSNPKQQTKNRAREKVIGEDEESDEVKARTRASAASRVQSRGKVNKRTK